MKQLESHSYTIGENVYYIRPMPAFKASNVFGELVALATPLLAGLLPLANEENALDVDLESAAPAIGSAFSSLSGDQLEKLLRILLLDGGNISVEVDGQKAQRLTEDLVNELFCEEMQDMFILAFEVIRTNYNGFFAKAAAQFGLAFKTLTNRVAM